MLRIELRDAGGTDQSTVTVAGRLAGPWVAELVRVLDGLATTASIVVDLTEVSFADAAGVRLLRALRRRDAFRLRCSAFLAAQLD